jgi:aspartyl aminopeptidase
MFAVVVAPDVATTGVDYFKIIGTHTDTCQLKIAPNSRLVGPGGFEQVNVQVYGGGLWKTYFDRDLTFAGRVIVQTKKGSLEPRFWHHEAPIMTIPSLAIHLTDKADPYSFNDETHLKPILCTQLVDRLYNPEAEGSDDGGFELLQTLKSMGLS